MEKYSFKMSPNMRLRMTLDREIDLDPNEKIFNHELFSEYRQRHSEALTRQAGLIKAIIWSDAALALFISGRNINIPTLDIGLSDLPVAREVLAISASLTFMFLCVAFTNIQLYEAILQTLAKRKALGSGIDPEFLSSAYLFSEMHLKTNRTKMNLWGVDFFEPGISFRIYYGAITSLMMLSMIGIILLHFGLILNATWPHPPVSA
jgi:hypothetical protein